MFYIEPKRLRIFQLVDILKKQTDEEHPLSTNQLCSMLGNCDRKTIYRDVDMLIDAGYEIFSRMESKEKVYYMMEREFNVAELRILIDAVQASAFIPVNQTNILIEKIICLAGNQKREIIKNNTVQFRTKKHSNEEIFSNIEVIENALQSQKQISFYYFTLDEYANRKYKYDKKIYIVEPSALIYNQDKYYLRAYSPENEQMRNYRVDRMTEVQMMDCDVSKNAMISADELTEYTNSVFGMYSGKSENIVLKFKDSLLDVIYDRFGEDANVSRFNENTCMVFAKVQVSGMFFGWLMQFPDKVQIISPECLIKEYQEWKNKEFIE